MKKLKALMLGVLSVLTLGLFVVTGVKVNAAKSEAPYGKYEVTNTETTSTALWDFSNADDMPESNVTVKSLTDTSLYGIGGDSSKGITLKASEKNISNNKTGILYVPIPSADAAGSIKILGSSSNSARKMTLAVVTQDEGSTLTDKEYTYSSTEATIAFDSHYVTTNGSTYWLKFDPNSQEVKIKKITVILTSSTQYEATASKINVNIKDGSTTLKTYELESGSSFTTEFKMWGYSSVSYYTDSSLTTPYSGAALTADTDLYISKTADATDYGYNLTSAMISTLSGVYNSSSEIVISDYYTKKADAVVTSSYLQLKNTEAQSLVINVPAGGLYITVSCSTGGSSDRNIYLYSETFGENAVSSFTTSLPSSDYTPRNVSAILDEGTYYLAGADNIRVYSVTMEEIDMSTGTTAAVFAEKNSAGDTLRFVGTLTGITDLSNISKIELFLEKDGVAANKAIELTTCYTSVSGSSQECGEATGTFYVIFRLNGIDSLAAGTKISKQLKITFTDGSTTLSTASEITL